MPVLDHKRETENGELQCIQRRAPEQTGVWKYALKCQELYLLYRTTFKRLLNQNLQVPIKAQDSETTLMDEGKTTLSGS